MRSHFPSRLLARSTLARNTGWMLLAQGARVLFQVAYFVLVARALGSAGFGALVAGLALVSVLMPFAGWGSGNVLVMYAARNPHSLPVHWGNALWTIVFAALPLTLLTTAIALAFVPAVSLQLILLLAAAEFVFMRISDSSAQAFQAVERMRATAVLAAIPYAFRFAAAVLFVTVGGGGTPETWAAWHLLGSAAGSALAGALVVLRFGRPRRNLGLARRNAREGGLFSLSLAATTIHADIDKVMLARLATLDAAGIYAAAYRAIGVVFLPVTSLLFATYARFFRHGAKGIRETTRFARRLLPVSAAYGALASVALFLLAPVAPLLLGEEFRESTDALRLLAAVPLLQSIQYLAADALTGAGRQGLRSLIQVAAAALNVVLNLWLIPQYSWQGAAWATLASAAALAVGLWIALAVLTRRPFDARAQSHENPRLASL